MEPPKDEHKHVELKTMKRDAEGSDRSAKGSARGHKPSASVPGVPVLQHLRSFVDTPASHEFRTEAPHSHAFRNSMAPQSLITSVLFFCCHSLNRKAL